MLLLIANDDADDILNSNFNSGSLPSPALSGSDDDLDGLGTSIGIRNWQSNTSFRPVDRTGSALGWDFAKSNEYEDANMSSGLNSPRRPASPSPAVVEIRVDEGDVAKAASGVDMSTSAHMDELE